MTDFEQYKDLSREDEVKNLFISLLNVSLDMRHNIDCYTPNCLFEFKYDKDIRKPDVLAQAIYYLNCLHEHGENIPSFIVLVNIDEIAIFESSIFKDDYIKKSLFAVGSPSSPDQKVIDLANKHKNELYFYSLLDNEENFNTCINCVKDLLSKRKIIPDKIKLTNVKRAYEGYVRQLGDYILSQSSSNGVFEFRADAIGKATIINESICNTYTMDFAFDNGAKRIENIDKFAYDSYWKQWKRIETADEATAVFKTIYDLLGISDKRTKGQFYTPNNLAKEAWKRIETQLGEKFWESGNWRIWDCCAGTGNLEHNVIPTDCLQYLYLSTLDIEEVDQLKNNFPLNRAIFQFNFLDDHMNKLPANLKEDINNPDIKWLFLINPPYVEAQGKSGVQSGTTQSNLQQHMKIDGLGDSAREMFAQFLYRIEKEFKNKYYLGLFSEVKFIVSKKFDAFRKYWRPDFDGGFVVNACEHFQCKGEWPLTFSLFNRTYKKEWVLGEDHWRDLTLAYDVLDKDLNIVQTKIFNVYDKNNNLRLYFPKNSDYLPVRVPVIKSGINLATGTKYMDPYGPRDFMGSMMFIGPDFQQQNRCFLSSGILNSNHNTIFITKDNYIDILIGFSLYKAPEISWLTNKDVFGFPKRELTNEEKADCLLYSLVCNSNGCVTYRFSDGSTIQNYFNPLDTSLFDFSCLSTQGKETFDLVKKYLEEEVKYDKLSTLFGTGVFLGFYQYKTTPDATHDQCFGFKFSQSLEDSIEKLRKRVESISLDVCF